MRWGLLWKWITTPAWLAIGVTYSLGYRPPPLVIWACVISGAAGWHLQESWRQSALEWRRSTGFWREQHEFMRRLL